jgi:hypothetical protein
VVDGGGDGAGGDDSRGEVDDVPQGIGWRRRMINEGLAMPPSRVRVKG